MDKELEIIKEAIEEKKGKDIKILELEGSSLADYLVIATGSSKTNIKAISEGIDKKLYEAKVKRLGIEGYAEGEWILLDYDNIIVQLFNQEKREFYNIEEAMEIKTVLYEG
ncbi:MAG: ribosome silencing factor [Fusobacteriia bacterium 4572_132]|nr:MAG: ribosome silencing factor [Fusobacteriia bacterium 4572_132]